MSDITGPVRLLGDRFACHQIVPTRFDFRRTADWDAAAEHFMEDSGLAENDWPAPGDIIVAGSSFGTGHAHYHLQAVKALQVRGVRAVFARSFNAIFQRTAVNEGLPAWTYGADLDGWVSDGHVLELDMASGRARDQTTGMTRDLRPVAPVVLEILDAGGLLPATERRLAPTTS